MAKLTAEERKKLHLVLRKVRIVYPEVFEPKHNDLSGKDEYSVQVRLYENNPEQVREGLRRSGLLGQGREAFPCRS